jgi:hypothetical protein
MGGRTILGGSTGGHRTLRAGVSGLDLHNPEESPGHWSHPGNEGRTSHNFSSSDTWGIGIGRRDRCCRIRSAWKLELG